MTPAVCRSSKQRLEKPLATSVSDAQAILHAVNQSDRVVLIGVDRRGDPSWQTVQHLLSSGQMGQVRQISIATCADFRIFREEMPTRGSLTVYGAEGMLTADLPGSGAAESIVLEKNGVKHAVQPEGDRISPAVAFIACILDGAPNIAPVEDAANVVAFIQGAYNSIAEGRIVRIYDIIPP